MEEVQHKDAAAGGIIILKCEVVDDEESTTIAHPKESQSQHGAWSIQPSSNNNVKAEPELVVFGPGGIKQEPASSGEEGPDDPDDDLSEFSDDPNDEDYDLPSSEQDDDPLRTDGSPTDSIDIDLSIVKEESVNDDDLPADAARLLASSDPNADQKSVLEIDGMKIESVGNYSKCPRCEKSIKSTFILRHIKLHDLPTESHTCPEEKCNLKVKRVNNLFRHLRVVHGSKQPYFCKYCFKRYSKSKDLKDHLYDHRTERRARKDAEKDNRVYICEFPGCLKEYGKRHHLKEHERKHTGDARFACEVCGKRFFIQAHLKRHLYQHTGIKPHVCRWKCGAIFASYGGRMKHERINHYSQNPLQGTCDICGKPFKNQQQLRKHRMTHLNPEERKDYRCSFCHIMFDTIKMRERHEQRHRDGEVFSCETCNKVFKNEKNLHHHNKTHHDHKPMSQNPTTPKKDKEKEKHACHLCPEKKLYCLTSLRRHLARIHSRNFRCPRDECAKYFKEEKQLKAHVRMHEMRECHLCGKKFQRKQNTDIHLVGVHGMSKDDLKKLGRWDKNDVNPNCPEYMTRQPWTKNGVKVQAPEVKKKGPKMMVTTHFKRAKRNKTEVETEEIEVKEEPIEEAVQ